MSSLGVTPDDLDLREALLFGQQLVQRSNRCGGGAQWFPHARRNQRSQPFAEFPGLSGDFVQRVASPSSNPCRDDRINDLGLLQPADKVLSVTEPIDYSALRGSNGVEEINRQMIADEKRGRPVRGHTVSLGRGIRILCNR